MQLQRIHHVAYRCKDAKETVNWYVKHLNMNFVLAIAEDQVPSTKVADPSDLTVIARNADRASREGPVLRLKLQGGRSLKITDCDDEGACEADRFRKHRLVAWWPSLGYYVVGVGLYEEGLAYLVSEKDGRTTLVAAPPARLTADHGVIFVLPIDQDLGADPARIERIVRLGPVRDDRGRVHDEAARRAGLRA